MVVDGKSLIQLPSPRYDFPPFPPRPFANESIYQIRGMILIKKGRDDSRPFILHRSINYLAVTFNLPTCTYGNNPENHANGPLFHSRSLLMAVMSFNAA